MSTGWFLDYSPHCVFVTSCNMHHLSHLPYMPDNICHCEVLAFYSQVKVAKIKSVVVGEDSVR